MFEADPAKHSRSNFQVLIGFLLGIAASLGCLFFSILLGTALALRQKWMFPALTALGLIAVGIVSLRHARESSYALGIVIAMSLALLLDGVCSVTILK